MEENGLAKKLRIKPAQKILIVNAPATYLKELLPLPVDVSITDKIRGTFDQVQVFVKSTGDIAKYAQPAAGTVNKTGILWVMYPKISSGIKTDINRDRGWEMLTQVGWEGVSLVSVNDTWSALRFKMIDDNKKVPEVSGPQKFTALLEKHEGMDATYFSLPFSVPEIFGSKAQVRVKGTLNGIAFSGTLAPYGGVHYLGITKELRKKCGIAAGDSVKVVLERDTADRSLEVPEDFRTAMEGDQNAKRFFEGSSYTNRKEYIGWVETAKRQETRESRIQKAIDRLAKGQKFS